MDIAILKSKLQDVIDLVQTDLNSIRSGRATPALVEDIVVEAYGGQSRLRIVELATIMAQDHETLVITPFDKQVIGEIRKGIEAANVGLNPSIDGQIIRISLPQMTTEDREKYVKILGQKLESGKIMLRQVRGDAMKDIKTAFEKKDLTEDEKYAQEKVVQDIVDTHTEKVEQMGEIKKKELLQI